MGVEEWGVCVCVCERDRERQKKRMNEWEGEDENMNIISLLAVKCAFIEDVPEYYMLTDNLCCYFPLPRDHTVLQGWDLLKWAVCQGQGPKPLWMGADQAFVYSRILFWESFPSSGALYCSSLWLLMSVCTTLPAVRLAQKLPLLPSIPLGFDCATVHLKCFPVWNSFPSLRAGLSDPDLQGLCFPWTWMVPLHGLSVQG